VNKEIAEQLAAEAEEAERHADEDDHGPSYRRKHPPRDPAQVYSLRIPVAQIEELRQLAADKGVTPSALMREWVLERLAAEKAGAPGALTAWERLQEILSSLEGAQRRLEQASQASRRADANAARGAAHLTLDPHDEEHKEIRALITDQVVERMEEEIAEWRQERASGSGR
jgi:aryl-alcohol dehydrogenase-like predicted oxidoreductase